MVAFTRQRPHSRLVPTVSTACTPYSYGLIRCERNVGFSFWENWFKTAASVAHEHCRDDAEGYQGVAVDGRSWYVGTRPDGPRDTLSDTKPHSVASFRLILLIVATWLSLEFLQQDNPLSPFILVSYPLPLSEADGGMPRYAKGPKDILFLVFYVLVFSFIRQAALRYIITPVAHRAGIKGQRKVERFIEQGYAFMYWTTSSVIGLVRRPTVRILILLDVARCIYRQSCPASQLGGTILLHSGSTIPTGACDPT